MKKSKILFQSVILIFVLFSFACDKSKASSDSTSSALIEESKEANNTSVQPVKRSLTTKEAVVLYPGTPLYTENEDGKMVYVSEVAEGDKLFVYYDGNNVDSKDAIRRLNNGKEDPFTFVHVATEFSGDKNYWTRELFFAREHSYVGLILDDTYVYKSPQSFDVTDQVLKQGMLVALKEDIIRENDFTPVTIYNGLAGGSEIYIKTELLSTLQADVLAVQTMNKLKEIEKPNEVVVNKLMELLADLDTSSSVSEFLFGGNE